MFGLQKEESQLYETLSQVFYITAVILSTAFFSLMIAGYIGTFKLSLPFVGTLIDTSVKVHEKTATMILIGSVSSAFAGFLMEGIQLRRKPESQSFKDERRETDVR